MAVQILNTSIHGAVNIDSTSWGHTVSAGNNKLLFVTLGGRTTGDIKPADNFSVTYNGIALTRLYYINANYRQWVAFYYLVNPPVGSYTLTANPDISGGGVNRTFFGSAYTLADVKVPTDWSSYITGGASSGTSGSLSRTATRNGSLLIDNSVSAGGTTGSLGAGQNALYLGIIGGDTIATYHTSYKLVNSGSNSMSFSGRNNDIFSYQLVLIEPVDEGGSFLFNLI